MTPCRRLALRLAAVWLAGTLLLAGRAEAYFADAGARYDCVSVPAVEDTETASLPGLRSILFERLKQLPGATAALGFVLIGEVLHESGSVSGAAWFYRRSMAIESNWRAALRIAAVHDHAAGTLHDPRLADHHARLALYLAERTGATAKIRPNNRRLSPARRLSAARLDAAEAWLAGAAAAPPARQVELYKRFAYNTDPRLRHHALADHFLSLAAQREDPRAVFLRAWHRLQHHSDAVHPSLDSLLWQLQASAWAGYPPAQAVIGRFHLDGTYFERDPFNAYCWLELAARQGFQVRARYRHLWEAFSSLEQEWLACIFENELAGVEGKKIWHQ